jgi:UDP-N-acetylglucosamine acyltransferase
MSDIHPTAAVHPSAQIDPSASIGPFAFIGEDTRIGAGTVVGAHAVVEFATLGKNNRLHPGCFIGTPPQDLKYKGERTRLVMGDNNTVREGVTLNRGTTATGETRIGSNCLFMANSHAAHDCRIGDNVILVNSTALAGHVEVADCAIFGGLSGVHQFVRVGRFCMIGAGSMVGKDVPPFCTCQGDRATLRGLNLIGLRRAGFAHPAVSAVKAAYRTLFLSSLRLEEALAQLRSSNPGPEVAELVSFLEGIGKRGVMRAATGESAEEEVTV